MNEADCAKEEEKKQPIKNPKLSSFVLKSRS